MVWMIFGRRRVPRPPSAEALASIHSSARELVEARKLRQESAQVGEALTRTQVENHIAASLIAAIQGGKVVT